MSENTFEKYLSRGDRPTDVTREDAAEAVEDLGAFGWIRGINARAAMLDLRKRNGNRLAIPYSWISSILLDPSTGLIMVAGDRKIAIEGQNLNVSVSPRGALYDGLACHKIAWVRESDAATAFATPSEGCVVHAITW